MKTFQKRRGVSVTPQHEISIKKADKKRTISVQLGSGWVLSTFIPFFVVNAVYGFPISNNQWICLAGCMGASLVGYASFRKLHVFPGITSGGYILTTFSASYFALAVFLLMLRVDYSRIQILLSYSLGVAFYILIHVFLFSRKRLFFGFIPGGNVKDLPNIERVVWMNVADETASDQSLTGVVADFGFDHDHHAARRISSFALSGIPVYPVMEVREQLIGQVEIRHLSENTLGSLNPSDLYLQLKGVTDRIAALVMIFALAPIMCIVGILIRLDSKGPAIFRQRRVGFRGVPFTVFKFRTMRVVQDETCDRRRAMTVSNDPRITKIGKFLRRSRIDEFPQLLNIVRGEMSFIGPRPEATTLSEWYEGEIPFYNYRHIINPGLTGWAQVSQGHVSDIDDVYKKLHLDFYYIKYISFWLDVLIVLRTIRTMTTGYGAK